MADDANPYAQFNGQEPTAPVQPAADNPYAQFSPKAPSDMSPKEYAADLAKSYGIGVVEGGINSGPGAPRELAGAIIDKGASALGVDQGYVDTGKKLARAAISGMGPIGTILANAPTPSEVKGAVEGVTGPFYESKSTGGDYARTLGQTTSAALLGGGNSLRQVAANVVRYGVIPGVASETAGQVTGQNPWAKGVVALVTGGIAGALHNPGTVENAIAKALPPYVTDAHIQDAQALIQHAASGPNPVNLTWPEALSQVTGRPVMQDLQRIAESSPQSRAVMEAFLGGRPQQVGQAARTAAEGIAPAPANPSLIGGDVRDAARGALADTPEGQRAAQSVYEAGPNTTPEQAGQVIQPELKNVYDRREGMRAALGDKDFQAARDAPADVPLNGDFGFRDVTSHYPWPERPTMTQGPDGRFRRMTEAESKAAALEDIQPVERMNRGPGGKFQKWGPGEQEAETQRRYDQSDADRARMQAERNVTERRPVIGLQPTEFGQLDTHPVVNAIDEAISTAKGQTLTALKQVRSSMHTPTGELDTSVEGIENARGSINDLISQAKQAGANNLVKQLSDARDSVEAALAKVPNWSVAKSNFEAASKPLEPFAEGTAPGKIVERDQFDKRFTTPPEQVPNALDQAGASGARDFLSAATPAARDAYEGHLTTQILNQATKAGADLSAATIRQVLRDKTDVLNQFPGVRSRLENVAASQEALDRLNATPLGQLARKDPTTKRAMDALFPRNPIAGSEDEIGQAVSALARKNPTAAQQLVREHIATTMNESMRSLGAEGSQFSGARLAIQLAGNPQQRANLKAAITALPGGAARWDGFNKFLDVMEATGQRQPIGSRTSFNSQELQSLSGTTNPLDKVRQALAPREYATLFQDKIASYRLGKNLNQLAKIITDPNSGALLQRLSRTRAESPAAQAIARNILTQAAINGSASTPTDNGK